MVTREHMNNSSGSSIHKPSTQSVYLSTHSRCTNYSISLHKITQSCYLLTLAAQDYSISLCTNYSILLCTRLLNLAVHKLLNLSTHSRYSILLCTNYSIYLSFYLLTLSLPQSVYLHNQSKPFFFK